MTGGTAQTIPDVFDWCPERIRYGVGPEEAEVIEAQTKLCMLLDGHDGMPHEVIDPVLGLIQWGGGDGAITIAELPARTVVMFEDINPD